MNLSAYHENSVDWVTIKEFQFEDHSTDREAIIYRPNGGNYANSDEEVRI